tara:strand:+ start:26 stop:433 length:408 start_codon:yes stop_codon:yes gene_type:complete
MGKLCVCFILVISNKLFANVIEVTCNSDKVFSVYRVGQSYESYEEINKLTTSVLIDLAASEIKISWRNDTYNTAGDIEMKVIDVRNNDKIILGLRVGLNNGYELHQFDLESLQTNWSMFEPSVTMYILSKCSELN